MSPFVYARILVIAILLTATAACSQAVAQPVAPDGSWKPAADPMQTTVIDVNMVWPWMYLDFLPGENFVIEMIDQLCEVKGIIGKAEIIAMSFRMATGDQG